MSFGLGFKGTFGYYAAKITISMAAIVVLTTALRGGAIDVLEALDLKETDGLELVSLKGFATYTGQNGSCIIQTFKTAGEFFNDSNGNTIYNNNVEVNASDWDFCLGRDVSVQVQPAQVSVQGLPTSPQSISNGLTGIHAKCNKIGVALLSNNNVSSTDAQFYLNKCRSLP